MKRINYVNVGYFKTSLNLLIRQLQKRKIIFKNPKVKINGTSGFFV